MENDLLAQNAYLDARDSVADAEQPFQNADLTQHKEQGIDLHLASQVWLMDHYKDGTDRFLDSVKKDLIRRGSLTQGQARAVLNNWRKELRNGQDSVKEPEPKNLKCFLCPEVFPTWDELNAHKSQAHGKAAPPQPFADQGEAKAVLEVTTSKLGLDLSTLPDGRYAAPDPSGKNDNIFLMVKRVRTTKPRDRRYEAAGRVISGNEIVVAGTIEVKEWSSESKELVGEQKPNDVYRGKYEEQLELVMMSPENFAILFGRLIGYCCRCGRKLTDKDSRDIGLGLECEKYLHEHYFQKPPEYTYVGADRPDPEKEDKHDQDYLSKKLTRYIEPPKAKVLP